MAKSVLFSYAREDEPLRNRVEQALALLKREGVISAWHDRRILPGSKFGAEIDSHFETDDVILLLVSASFIDSNWCYEREMAVALKRHEAGEAIVVPIILRDCDWHSAPFGELQALPEDGKPITSWENIDEALADVARGLRKLLTK